MSTPIVSSSSRAPASGDAPPGTSESTRNDGEMEAWCGEARLLELVRMISLIIIVVVCRLSMCSLRVWLDIVLAPCQKKKKACVLHACRRFSLELFSFLSIFFLKKKGSFEICRLFDLILFGILFQFDVVVWFYF